MRWLTPGRRRRLYRIANAGLGVAVVYGIVQGDEAAAWLFLVNAVLFVADAHVPTSEQH